HQLERHKWKTHIADNSKIRCNIKGCGLQSNLYLCYKAHLEIHKRREFQRLFNFGHRIVPELPAPTLTSSMPNKLIEKRYVSLNSTNASDWNNPYRCKHQQCVGLPLFKSEKAFAE